MKIIFRSILQVDHTNEDRKNRKLLKTTLLIGYNIWLSGIISLISFSACYLCFQFVSQVENPNG